MRREWREEEMRMGGMEEMGRGGRGR